MKCLSMHPHSKVIITENLDMYEVMQEEDSPGYFLVKLPAKATIDFKQWYGENGKIDNGVANWAHPHCPWYEENGKLIWDY